MSITHTCGSVHAYTRDMHTYMRAHVQTLQVGSTFRLGQSTRIYVFNGPSELMPEEGLSRTQRKQLAALEYARKMQEKDRQSAKAQMAAAVAGDVTWGMGEDAADMDPEVGCMGCVLCKLPYSQLVSSCGESHAR